MFKLIESKLNSPVCCFLVILIFPKGGREATLRHNNHSLVSSINVLYSHSVVHLILEFIKFSKQEKRFIKAKKKKLFKTFPYEFPQEFKQESSRLVFPYCRV